MVRNYDAEGKAVDSVESTDYAIIDEEGATIGSATCNPGNGYMTIHVSGASGIDSVALKLASYIGAEVEDEKGGEA